MERYRDNMKKEEKRRKKRKLEKTKKQRYVPQKALFGSADDYWIYKMSPLETLIGCGMGFGVGFLICMVFFRNFLLAIAAGVVVVFPACRKYQNYLKEKRSKTLLLQFKDMMESLSSSFSAGKNTSQAFQDAYAEMAELYGRKSDIARELEMIVQGTYNGVLLNDLLDNFAKRSHLDDVESFATVFEVCSRYGGNLRKVVGETRVLINDKINTELEIQTLLTANRNELNIMTVMPIMIMLTLNGTGNMSIIENTRENVIAKFVALGLFVGAYLIGKKVIDVKV